MLNMMKMVIKYMSKKERKETQSSMMPKEKMARDEVVQVTASQAMKGPHHAKEWDADMEVT